ncbi:DinB family protein [Herbiconiux sp.]|uniref:DinB family protein n=1 Tax=Herbiconiux sp. TaxID=1871186 RepID=UPI0025B84241|nr:DinB family protein [Herbiconiux sp.]
MSRIPDPLADKETLHGYLRVRRADLLAKLDGLGEYDIRRPMTPTGTNLLGLVKHVASVQLGYFGEVFGRLGRDLPWNAPDAAAEADLWATADESRAQIIELHEYSAAHSDATIAALDWDTRGAVPWWPPERRSVTLQQILAHMVAETARHAGHADILRELIDGAVGNGAGDPNIADRGDSGWAAHHARVEAAARAASGGALGGGAASGDAVDG